jgi:hypothetical protein
VVYYGIRVLVAVARALYGRAQPSGVAAPASGLPIATGGLPVAAESLPLMQRELAAEALLTPAHVTAAVAAPSAAVAGGVRFASPLVHVFAGCARGTGAWVLSLFAVSVVRCFVVRAITGREPTPEEGTPNGGLPLAVCLGLSLMSGTSFTSIVAAGIVAGAVPDLVRFATGNQRGGAGHQGNRPDATPRGQPSAAVTGPSAAELQAAVAEEEAQPATNGGGVCCVCMSAPSTWGFVHTSLVHACLCASCVSELRARRELGNCLVCRQQALTVARVVQS